MERPNAALRINGTSAREAVFTCDQALDLKKFKRAIADIARHGDYTSLTLHPKDAGSEIDTRDCLLRAGVILSWGIWVEIGNHLYMQLEINVDM